MLEASVPSLPVLQKVLKGEGIERVKSDVGDLGMPQNQGTL